MEAEKLNEILSLHETWVDSNRLDGARADLKDANLRDADLRGANLIDADLRDADLSGADLRGADLIRANLRDADLRGADLKYADLIRADLRGVDLDFSCFPLWCGSLKANMDDRLVKQLLYHVLSIVKNSSNVSDEIKSALLTEGNLEIVNQFHRVEECGEL